MNLRKWLVEENEALWDRALRLIAGAVMLSLFAFGPNLGWLNYVVLFFGVMWVFTGITGHCIFYVPFGLNTKELFRGKKAAKPAVRKKRK